jgi:hypothetical protein
MSLRFTTINAEAVTVPIAASSNKTSLATTRDLASSITLAITRATNSTRPNSSTEFTITLETIGWDNTDGLTLQTRAADGGGTYESISSRSFERTRQTLGSFSYNNAESNWVKVLNQSNTSTSSSSNSGATTSAVVTGTAPHTIVTDIVTTETAGTTTISSTTTTTQNHTTGDGSGGTLTTTISAETISIATATTTELTTVAQTEVTQRTTGVNWILRPYAIAFNGDFFTTFVESDGSYIEGLSADVLTTTDKVYQHTWAESYFTGTDLSDTESTTHEIVDFTIKTFSVGPMTQRTTTTNIIENYTSTTTTSSQGTVLDEEGSGTRTEVLAVPTTTNRTFLKLTTTTQTGSSRHVIVDASVAENRLRPIKYLIWDTDGGSTLVDGQNIYTESNRYTTSAIQTVAAGSSENTALGITVGEAYSEVLTFIENAITGSESFSGTTGELGVMQGVEPWTGGPQALYISFPFPFENARLGRKRHRIRADKFSRLWSSFSIGTFLTVRISDDSVSWTDTAGVSSTGLITYIGDPVHQVDVGAKTAKKFLRNDLLLGASLPIKIYDENGITTSTLSQGEHITTEGAWIHAETKPIYYQWKN